MKSYLIINAKIVNEGQVTDGDLLIRSGRIEKIGKSLSPGPADQCIDVEGRFLLPGAIDDQVHFREPGLTHKGTIETEAKAAVAGGVTSFMEMPNTVPPVFSQQLLQEKFEIASRTSLANYSFFMGSSNENFDEVMKTDLRTVCGLKIFMGSSTGDLLVDKPDVLEKFFGEFGGLIAVHCEDEATIRRNTETFKARFGEDAAASIHPLIRNEEACYISSSFAIGLARKKGTQLHLLHISTGKETSLFSNEIPLAQKKITAEACIHHLWFSNEDYDRLGTKIKWNPAIKTAQDRKAIFEAVLDDRIDLIATDHAPHSIEEKSNAYFKSPSGGPMVQHSLVAMLEFYKKGMISIQKIAEKMSHNPAILFKIEDRGFIREGNFADIVIVDTHMPWVVERENILAKCRWSPFEGQTFQSRVLYTFVSGALVYEKGKIVSSQPGKRLLFNRN